MSNLLNGTREKEKSFTNSDAGHLAVTFFKNPNKRNASERDVEQSLNEMKDIDKHLHNLRTILINSNATPVRNYSSAGYECAFCSNRYSNPKSLKEHTLEEHNSLLVTRFMKGHAIDSYVIKLDITEMRCRTCNIMVFQLDTFVEHLETDHGVFLYNDIKSHILPFKWEDDSLIYGVCSTNYVRFKILQEHMRCHFRNYVCEFCSAGFVNRQTYRAHIVRHDLGEFNCKVCNKLFDTKIKRAYHEKYVHVQDQKRNKCPHCPEKFISFNKKNRHMEEKHGVRPLVFKCMACDHSVSNGREFGNHIQ